MQLRKSNQVLKVTTKTDIHRSIVNALISSNIDLVLTQQHYVDPTRT